MRPPPPQPACYESTASKITQDTEYQPNEGPEYHQNFMGGEHAPFYSHPPPRGFRGRGFRGGRFRQHMANSWEGHHNPDHFMPPCHFPPHDVMHPGDDEDYKRKQKKKKQGKPWKNQDEWKQR